MITDTMTYYTQTATNICQPNVAANAAIFETLNGVSDYYNPNLVQAYSFVCNVGPNSVCTENSECGLTGTSCARSLTEVNATTGSFFATNKCLDTLLCDGTILQNNMSTVNFCQNYTGVCVNNDDCGTNVGECCANSAGPTGITGQTLYKNVCTANSNNATTVSIGYGGTGYVSCSTFGGAVIPPTNNTSEGVALKASLVLLAGFVVIMMD